MSWPSIIVSTFKDTIIQRCIDGGVKLIFGTSSRRAHGLKKKSLHFNLLKMCAIFLALHSFQDRLIGHTVRLMNTTTSIVLYINKPGRTISSSLYLLARGLDRIQYCDLDGPIHQGFTKYGSGPAEPSGPGYGHGIVPPSPSSLENLPVMGGHW